METTPKVRQDVASPMNLLSKSVPSALQPGDQSSKPHFPASGSAPHAVSKAHPVPAAPRPARPTSPPPGDWEDADGPAKKARGLEDLPPLAGRRALPKTWMAALGPKPPRCPPPHLAPAAAGAASSEDSAVLP